MLWRPFRIRYLKVNDTEYSRGRAKNGFSIPEICKNAQLPACTKNAIRMNISQNQTRLYESMSIAIHFLFICDNKFNHSFTAVKFRKEAFLSKQSLIELFRLKIVLVG